MRSFIICLAAIAGLCSLPAKAAPVTSFNGSEVTASFNITDDGGQGLWGGLITSNTATIGDGAEFRLSLGASGFNTVNLNLDFFDDGQVFLYADQQLALGGTSWTDWSFEISFSFTDPTKKFLSATSFGDLVRGDASVSGTDPIVWRFDNERDNSFGRIMTFGAMSNLSSYACMTQQSNCIVPGLQLTAEMTSMDPPVGAEVPLPAALPLFLMGIAGIGAVQRRRKSSRG